MRLKSFRRLCGRVRRADDCFQEDDPADAIASGATKTQGVSSKRYAPIFNESDAKKAAKISTFAWVALGIADPGTQPKSWVVAFYFYTTLYSGIKDIHR